MQININFDNASASAPSGFEKAILTAANIIDSVIRNPVTVTIDVDYGNYNGTPITGDTLGEAAPTGNPVAYGQLVTDLKSVATSATDRIFLNGLPTADPASGASYFLSAAQQKAFGLMGANSAEVDGYAGFSSTAAFDYDPSDGITAGEYDLVGVALHELTHALGRYMPANFVTPMDLMSYNANATIDTANNDPHYLSLDGGRTNLANFDVGSDQADFATGTPVDPFDAFLNAGATYGWTPLDTQIMDALGYDVGAAPPAPPSANNTVILPGNGTITDANGNSWSISSGLQVVVDGSPDPTTKLVVQMDYVNGIIWQENNSGQWFSKAAPADGWSAPFNTSPIPPPAISGTQANQTIYGGGTIHPFSSVTITDPIANAADALAINQRDANGNASDASGKLSGAGLTETAPGVYTLAATNPANLTAELQALQFTATGPQASPVTTSFALTVTDHAASLLGGAITGDQKTSIVQQPGTAPPPPGVISGPPNDFVVYDGSNGGTWQAAGQAYDGPVPGLTNEIIIPTTDNINVTAQVPNTFIHTGSGMDGITVASGTNIIDGSTNSNFMVGGSGHDTFYMDDRSPTLPIFSTIVNFHAGDDATVWGVDKQDFAMTVLDNQGAAGAKGVDLIFSAPGHLDTSFVLAGYTSADLSNGRLTLAYGRTQDLPNLPGSLYLTVHAT